MIEFLKEMTVENAWLWFHILAGGFLARSAYKFMRFRMGSRKAEKRLAILAVFVITLTWEIFELYYWGYANYSGGAMGWFADSLGDILGAVLMALVVVL